MPRRGCATTNHGSVRHFPLQDELDEKRARMAELTADLASTESVIARDEADLPNQPAA